MTNRLYLISLASTPALRRGCFPADDPLDERGRDETLAARLTDRIPPDARLLVSPARLAQDTAALWQRPAQTEAALADMDYGTWRGRSLADIAETEPAALNAWLQQADAPAGGAQSFAQLLTRVGAWLEQVDQPGEVVALTHAPVIRAAILHALQAPAECFTRIEVPPLSCFTLRRSARGWSLWPA